MKINLEYGVYKITNLVTSKVYVGSTCSDLKKRFREHFHHLRKNKHHSKKLQNSWNKYGEENFEISVLEMCSKDRCTEREQYWIDTFDSYYNGYNCTPKAQNCMGRPVSEETRQKISNTLKGRKCGRILTKEEFKVLGEARKKKVYQYTADGLFIQEYKSVSEFSNEIGVQSQIRVAIRADRCAKGFYWSYIYLGEKITRTKRYRNEVK